MALSGGETPFIIMATGLLLYEIWRTTQNGKIIMFEGLINFYSYNKKIIHPLTMLEYAQ